MAVADKMDKWMFHLHVLNPRSWIMFFLFLAFVCLLLINYDSHHQWTIEIRGFQFKHLGQFCATAAAAGVQMQPT